MKGVATMKYMYLLNWEDCGECVNAEKVNAFTLTQLLKGYGMEEDATALLIAKVDREEIATVHNCDGYKLIIMKVRA